MSEITRNLALTAELTGTELSAVSLMAMEAELSQYPVRAVLDALTRCRRELTGRLTLAAVLERINTSDGRPGADEAWATAILAHDEAETVVWTSEISMAFSVARPLLDLGDKVGARMAFRDAYERMVIDARRERNPVRWEASLGYDADRRRSVLSSAVEFGRLPAQYAQALLPSPKDSGVVDAIMGNQPLRLVCVDGVMSADEGEQRQKVLKRIAELKGMLSAKKSAA